MIDPAEWANSPGADLAGPPTPYEPASSRSERRRVLELVAGFDNE